jgi:hypothetical protein
MIKQTSSSAIIPRFWHFRVEYDPVEGLCQKYLENKRLDSTAFNTADVSFIYNKNTWSTFTEAQL